jgi:beta-glucanase (GH16 family)
VSRIQQAVVFALVLCSGCDESPATRTADGPGGPRDALVDSAAGRADATPDTRPASPDTSPASPDLHIEPDAPVGPWKLVWADEFNYQGLPDAAKWDYEQGYVRNNELQFYVKARLENSHVENGQLTIEAREDNYQGHAVTSASLITKGKASWTYGRIEMRAQIPTGKGSWPAFWTLGTNIDQVGWPACGEIDIMENVGFDPDTIHGTVHLSGVDKGGTFNASAPYTGFHVYAVEWFADRLDFYYDSNKYFTYPKTGTNGPFDKPQYLILNIAVGGSWGGRQGVDSGIYPLKMIVDYVRVYEHTP